MCFTYYDFNSQKKSRNIELIFPNWEPGKERIVILAPHDDDVILGSGYILTAAQESGADCFVLIFCNGNCGYSVVNEKDKIVEIRIKETVMAYKHLGIAEDHIFRFDYPDYSAISKLGWILANKDKGSFEPIIRSLRKIKATRVLIPNEYREHIDHYAVNIMGKYAIPQVGDPVAADWGKPYHIKSSLVYSVWGNFSPVDALLSNRSCEIRANCGIRVTNVVENKIIKAIQEYVSQAEIIKDMIIKREERKIENEYIEVYLKYDPRPILDYKPYRKLIERL